jgi:hypothetical protein
MYFMTYTEVCYLVSCNIHSRRFTGSVIMSSQSEDIIYNDKNIHIQPLVNVKNIGKQKLR